MEIEILAEGLAFPEGPIALPDGTILLVEVLSGHLTRVSPGGEPERIVHVGGGPNGAALGPDGRVYIANNGGLSGRTVRGITYTLGRATEYRTGSIQAVDLRNGQIETLYVECDGRPLCAPNDLAFDHTGNFWFTDHGHSYGRQHDRGAVFYASPDGNRIQEAIFPLDQPNGLGLSPDQTVLYVAETMTGRIWAFDLESPGQIARTRGPLGHPGRLVLGIGGLDLFDSLSVDSAGNIAVGTLVGTPGITEIEPSGTIAARWPLPDPFVTNIAFGANGDTWAYVTLSGTGRLARFRWPRRGR